MLKQLFAASALALLPSIAFAEKFETLFPGNPGHENPEVDQYLRAFDYHQGEIFVPGGQAKLNVPEGYYYLDPEDAEVVLTYFWGNPYGDTLGMIFPAEYTPMDAAAWGAEIQWEGLGYVSDEDADSYDYDSVLTEMQADTRAGSRERIEMGYGGVELVGWAEPPSYDKDGRKLHWALDLKFDDSETNTLNYELRALGREGVLNINFIASMDQLEQVKDSLPDVAEMASFIDGKRYSDFDPSIDTVAAVGIGGLIAGKVLAKTGLLAVALIFLKKFWFIALLPILWARKFFSKD